MITHILIPEDLKSSYKFSGKDDWTEGYNRINIFIGPNNSGKSRFLRALFYRNFEYQLFGLVFKQLNDIIDKIEAQITPEFARLNIVDLSGSAIVGIKKTAGELRSKLDKAKLPNNWELLQEVKNFIERLKIFEFSGVTNPKDVYSTNRNFDPLVAKIKEIGLKYFEEINRFFPNYPMPKYNKIYLPILRGLRPLQISPKQDNIKFDENSDNYRIRTMVDYFPDLLNDKEKIHSIFTGSSLYNDTKEMLLGTLSEREKIKRFEIFLSETFFNSQIVSLIPNIKEDCLHITIGNEDRPIYNLGDGIQSIIILLYPIFFTSEKNILCFIEEPELSLHPGLQRLFIDTILKDQFKNIQFFLTTHSNHFLDMTLDHEQISIYNFEKTGTSTEILYRITNTQNEDVKLLDSLGVRNSSIFLSNCTVWVEGITDRLYLNKYLEVYQKNLFQEKYEAKRVKEDFHFSYVEYGGVNIVHYSFDSDENWEKIKASKISNKILVIVDNDGYDKDLSSKKYQRILELKQHLKDNLIILPCREIENTLSARVLTSTISNYEDNLNFDFSNIKEEDYIGEYIGDFIEKNITGLKRKYTDKNGSGTIARKTIFCKTAIKYILTMEDLSESGKELSSKIFKFINMHNS